MKKGKRERERLRRDFTSQLNVTLNSNKLNYYCSSLLVVLAWHIIALRRNQSDREDTEFL